MTPFSEMNSRERMLTVLNNGRPDRLPCQVHDWMEYYRSTRLNGVDQWGAYEQFGLDFAIYVSPTYQYDDATLNNWKTEVLNPVTDEDGVQEWEEQIQTPGGTLHRKMGRNAITTWQAEHLCKTWEDFEIWNQYSPRPTDIDQRPVIEASKRLGDRGIIRSHPFYFGQGSPWQCFVELFGTQESIMLAMDEPERVHQALECILDRAINAHRMWEGMPTDVVETDGGAGSTTVIGPRLFREFCLPYDQRQNKQFRELGIKTVCHLCGGIMANLEAVVETGADGLETMTPVDMGGDCRLAEASQRVGDQIFFIGGFDQKKGFEQGNPDRVREMVQELFEATRDQAGYICSPSDHFFYGEPENIHAFVEACKSCVY